MSNIDFPKDKTKTLDFSLLCSEVKKALLSSHEIRETNLEKGKRTKPVYWRKLGDNANYATSFSPSKILSTDCLAESLEDQGIDTLDEIIGVAITLGIQQGLRIAEYRITQQEHIINLYKAALFELKL